MDTERNPSQFSHYRNNPQIQPSPLTPTTSIEDGNGEQTLDFNWLLSVIRRRGLVMVSFAIILTSVIGAFLVWKAKTTPKIYEGFFRILVEPITAEGRLSKQFLLTQASTARTDIQLERNVTGTSLVDYETLIRVLQSPKLLSSVVEKIQTKYPEVNYETLMRNLNLRRITYEISGLEEGTKILVITYQDVDPGKIQFVLENITNAYLEYSRQERLTSLNQGIQFIEEQLPELQQRFDHLQKRLEELRQQQNFIDPVRTGNYLTDHALIVERNSVDVRSRLVDIQAKHEALERQLETDISGASVLAQDAAAYQKLLDEIQKIDAEIATQSAQLREDSAPMRTLREKQRNLRSLSREEAEQVIDRVEGEIQGLEDRYQIMLQAERLATQRLDRLPEAARKYADLEQKLELATDSLKQFLARREALQLDTAQRQVPWELIEPPDLKRNAAGKIKPISSQQTSRQLALTGILSMILGVGVGFLVEVLHAVFHTPDDIQSAAKLPVLGVIPFSKELKRSRKAKSPSPMTAVAGLTRKATPNFILSNGTQTTSDNISDSNSPFWEAFRSLYTNIRLQSFDRPIESLVIGAATPEDGKSTVAVNLARTAAAIGQRVLLVDTDLRCPSIHEKLDLPNLRGLSDAITTDLSLNDVIQRSPDEENLFVLTAGPSPMDPMKMLTSKKMQYIHEQFKAFFDLTIYDTPPLIGVADGNYLAAQTDGIVLVVGLDKTDRALVTKALEGLTISGATVLGLVANGINGYTPKASAVYRRK